MHSTPDGRSTTAAAKRWTDGNDRRIRRWHHQITCPVQAQSALVSWWAHPSFKHSGGISVVKGSPARTSSSASLNSGYSRKRVYYMANLSSIQWTATTSDIKVTLSSPETWLRSASIASIRLTSNETTTSIRKAKGQRQQQEQKTKFG